MAKPADLPALTSLRFVAAFAVMLHHSAGFFPGYGGVSFFFTLSGFVLAYQAGNQTPADIPIFYAKRLARIIPLHLATLAAAIPLGGAGLPSNALLVQAWSANPNVYFGYNAVAWSLSAEAAFYFAFPVLVAVITIRRVTLGALAMLAVALSAAGVSDTEARAYFYVNPAFRVIEFSAGIALARAPTIARAPKSIVFSLIGVTTMGVWAVGALTPVTAGLVFIPASIVVISTFAQVRGILARPAFVYLGRISFALYMVGQLTQRYVQAVIGENLVANSIAIALAFPIACAAHHWIEQPFTRFARQALKHKTLPA